MSNDYWQRRLAAKGDNPVPIVAKRMHRVFWVPSRYKSVGAAVIDSPRFTIRQLAERTGYSVKGAWAAIDQMKRLGLLVVERVRGCKGYTLAKLQSDVSVTNVSTTERSLEKTYVENVPSNPRTEVETFAPLSWGDFKSQMNALFGAAS